MNRLGLIGGTSWVSSEHYYRILNEGVAARLGGASSAPVTLWSVEFGEFARMQHDGDWDGVAAVLVDAAQRSSPPVVTGSRSRRTRRICAPTTCAPRSGHAADRSGRADGGRRCAYRTVGLLGTQFTMSSAMFPDAFEARGVRTLLPSADEQRRVHDVIYDELMQGVVSDEARRDYLEIVDKLAADGAEAVVLACTEQGLLLKDGDAGVPLLDTTDIHCRALLEFILEDAMTVHTLSVLVENKPGVLARVAGLFSRRGFNIESLAVGPTEHPEISRITILVSVEGSALEQVTKQLNKLVNVLKIVELEQAQAVQRELLLVKVRADETSRRDVLQIVELFKAKVADVGPEALTIELTGRPDKLEAMLRMLEPYGIREMVQSGMVALGRGPRSMSQTALRSVERGA